MGRLRSLRPSPTIIVAIVALVAAVAGTAVAGPSASTSKLTKSKVRSIADKEIQKLAPGLSVANAANATNAANAANASQLNGNGSATFETTSASDVRSADQPLTGADANVLATSITVPAPKTVTATASIEATSNGGTDDNINCHLDIGGVNGPFESMAVTPNTLEDSTVLALTFSRVVDTGTHSVAVECNQGVGSVTTVQDRGLTAVATG